MKSLFAVVLTSALFMMTGCTWVSPNPQVKQEGIMVLPQDRVVHCRLLSKTEVSIAPNVGFINRVQSDVEKDLQTLAMNQAVTQNGDTVSALTPVNNGSQTFGIYKCLGPGATSSTSAPAASSVQTRPYQPPH